MCAAKHLDAISGGDSRTLLAPMLEGVEAKERQPRDILARCEDSKHATLFMWFI